MRVAGGFGIFVALLAAGLRGDQISLSSQDQTFQQVRRFEEHVDLRTANRSWETMASQMKTAAKNAGAMSWS